MFTEEREEKAPEIIIKEDKVEDSDADIERSQSEERDLPEGGATGSDGQEGEEFEVKVYGKNEAPKRAVVETEDGDSIDRLTVDHLDHHGHKKKHSKHKKKAS